MSRDGYEEATRLAGSHKCGQCGDRSRLGVRWDAPSKLNIAWCPVCKARDGFVKRKSLTQIWKENPEAVPVAVANRLAEKHRGSIEAVVGELPPELAEAVREHFGL